MRGLLRFVENVAFTLIVPGAVVLWIPRDVLGIWGEIIPSPWTIWQTVSLGPLAAGLAVYVRCVWEFAARGRGIPAPVDHPRQLVVTGLYRYVRNPMYVGVLSFLLGQATFFQSPAFLAYSAGWFLWVHLVVVFYEEPNLRQTFGASYADYAAAVGRWVPGKAYWPTLSR